MTGKMDRIQSKRGRNRLLHNSEKLVTRTLKLLDKLYQAANQDDAKKADITDAARMHLEILGYIKPKLQAIAASTLTEDGDLVAIQVRRIADALDEQKLLKAHDYQSCALEHD